MNTSLLPYVLLGTLAVSQATWIYSDARRRREDFAWLWGLFGLINVPSSLIVYTLVTRRHNTPCVKCGKPLDDRHEICPYCGSVRGGK